MELLVYLARHPGRVVSAERLLDDLWAGKIVTGSSLYNAVAELRSALNGNQATRPYIETIPKKGYRLIAPVTGLDSGQGQAEKRQRPKPYVVALVALALVSALVAWVAIRNSIWKVPADQAQEQTIAVLAFVNLSDDAENEYFSDGISEDLLGRLSRFSDLRVISRSSSFFYKGKDIQIPTIAEQLDVGLVLDGSVRKVGDLVRITARLIDARTDEQLWSEAYDRKLDDVFAVQDEISAAIIRAVRSELDLDIGETPRLTVSANTDAHLAYLRGRHLMAQESPNAMKRAIAEFEEAVSLDTDFALGHAELAIALLKAEPDHLTWEELIGTVEDHVEIAMTLDPDLAESHAAKGRLLWNIGHDDDALGYYRRAVRINPNYADAYEWLGRQPGLFGIDESFAAIETAARLDPLSRAANWRYIFGLILSGQLTEAERQIERYASIYPEGATILRGYLGSLGGRWSNRVLSYLQAASSGKDDLLWGGGFQALTHQLAAIGLEEEALRLAGTEDLETLGMLGSPDEAIALLKAPQRVGEFFTIGRILAHAGRYAEAREYLEQVWQRRDGELTYPSGHDAYLAEALFAVRRDAGDEAGAEEILAALRHNVRRYRDASRPQQVDIFHSVDYHEGVADYLSGNRDAGLALIAKAAEEGFWIKPPSLFQKPMYQEPEFVLILERQGVRQARERDRVLSIVCNDNPYATVWQPAEETCESYAEAVEGESG
jgi:TolB-like protein/DNA-binding winged helix-turn-helix (wHTH) protein